MTISDLSVFSPPLPSARADLHVDVPRKSIHHTHMLLHYLRDYQCHAFIDIYNSQTYKEATMQLEWSNAMNAELQAL